MERIGIFGGTFNPVHLGHLVLGQEAIESCKLSRLIFVPANIPPHKEEDTEIASPEHRLKMLELATAGNNKFEVSDVEIKRQGVSYTYDTVKHFADKNKERQIYLLLGADSLLELSGWHRYEELLELCRVVVFYRASADLTKVPKQINEHYQLISTMRIDLSATDIRAKIGQGKSVIYMVPEVVAKYLAEQKLYVQ